MSRTGHVAVCLGFALVVGALLPAWAGPPASGASGHDATVHHSFADVERWVRIFDDPARDAWQKPERLVAALDVRPGMAVADIGAGTGYLCRHLAAAVGPDGVVFAAEPEPGLVAHIRERAEREGTANVVPVLASLDSPRLPPHGVDRIVLLDTFHHVDDRVAYARRLHRVLRPGGQIAIVDWRAGDLPVGPPPEHRLPRRRVLEEMRQAGYRLVREPDFLPYQYFLVFSPAQEARAPTK